MWPLLLCNSVQQTVQKKQEEQHLEISTISNIYLPIISQLHSHKFINFLK